MEAFANLQSKLESEQETRESIRKITRQIDLLQRKGLGKLQEIHCAPSLSSSSPSSRQQYLVDLCVGVRDEYMHGIGSLYGELGTLLGELSRAEAASGPAGVAIGKEGKGEGQGDYVYYKFCDMWRNATQQVIQLCVLVDFIQKSSIDKENVIPLMRFEDVEKILLVEEGEEEEQHKRKKLKKSLAETDQQSQERKTRNAFHFDLEDYLNGVCLVSAELSRWAINCVTCGDYKRPKQIADFLAGLHAGVRLLNLKNDGLRRKFDGIKYDLKKVEEVVYDLAIRDLAMSGSSKA
eukprot:Nk52_evm5s375 gene=Nk52_evmTU5s375